MKEKLQSLFGTFGAVLYYLAMLLLFCAPLLVIDLPFWLDVIVFNVLLFSQAIPIIGDVLSLGIDVWALFIALRDPTDVLSIIFFVAFALNIIRAIISIAAYAASRKVKSDE